ncbi:clasp N terminal-domain-containing protein [Chlamydoabsidia padenii]|nr:clasp N terminal-domain-containing protein [Chlamydoabsidia padenii]
MKTNTSNALKKINSSKSLEKELLAATKLFKGKETELNWEQREQTLQLLNSLLHHEKLQEWKGIFIQGIHNLVFGIADATQSLRTKYALVAFDLIATIGQTIGMQLDATTFETLFTGLLRCVNSTKQTIANKARDTMISFLSTTAYHNKAISLLCLAFQDKNPQSRQFAALYMKTYLETHASNALVRENMEHLNSLKKVELFLKTGLLDATPAVRQLCSSTFWVYYKHWPSHGNRLLLSFDSTARKQLEKAKASLDYGSSIRGGQGKRPISSPMTTTNDTALRHDPKSTNLPPNKKVKSSKVSSQHASQSPSPIRNHSPALASASLLHMLRSNDTTINCNGLCILASRLSTHLHQCSSSKCYEMVLPSTVPRRTDLVPLLLGYLSSDRMRKDGKMCDQLMSWDCLTGIFVHIFSLYQFLPSVILAGQPYCRNLATQTTLFTSTRKQQQDYHSTCALGLQRLKIYLKYNNKNLMKCLIDILLMTITYGGAGLRDPNAKKELKEITTKVGSGTAFLQGNEARGDLVHGLVTWMDELVCGYIGLNDDDSEHNLIKECRQPWAADVLSSTTLGVATQWMADNDNLELCLESILRALKSYASATSSVVFTSLITLVGRLRLANARIFSMVVDQLDEDTRRLLNTCLGRQHCVDTVYQKVIPTEIIHQETCQQEQDDDPPPPYDDVLLSSPPSWNGIDQHKLSLSPLSSQEDGLDDTLFSGDDYDALDANLDNMSPESFLTSINDPFEMDGDLITRAHVTGSDPPTENINIGVTNNIDTEENDTATTNASIDSLDDSTAKVNDSDTLADAIYQLTATQDNKLYALETLQHFCGYYSAKDGNNGKNGQLWVETKRSGITDNDESLLELLIIRLVEHLHQLSPHEQQQQTMAILRIFKQLLIHQGDLLRQDNDTTDRLTLVMAEALIYVKIEKYGLIPLMVEEVIDLLLETVNIQTCLKVSAQLLKQQFEADNNDINHKSSSSSSTTTTTRNLSTITLFNMIAKLAPSLTGDMVDGFMKTQGCSDYFQQGINHSTLSIRQSCVNALVELSTCASDKRDYDIKGYLPNLRQEQGALLEHYIGLKRQQSTK